MSVEYAAILCVGVPIKVVKQKTAKAQFDPDTGLQAPDKVEYKEFTVIGETLTVEGVLGNLDTLDVICPDYETYILGQEIGVLGKAIAECGHSSASSPIAQIDQTAAERLKFFVQEELRKLGVEEEVKIFLLQYVDY